ncbi:MAG TPA: Type II secretory pathway component [Pseudomonas sp.]|nr:Type II secretory pathway component [Pseudomonas sp.]
MALDPTQPPTGRLAADAPAEAAASLHLQAILRGPGRASAVINGNILRVGDRVGDARILAVHRHAVVIDREGQQQELHLSIPIIQTSRTQP